MSCAGREDKGLGCTWIGSSGLMPPLRTCILTASCLWGWKAVPLSPPVCTVLPNSKSTLIRMLGIFAAALWGREGKYCHSCCTDVETKPLGRLVTYLLRVMKLTGKGQRGGGMTHWGKHRTLDGKTGVCVLAPMPTSCVTLGYFNSWVCFLICK